MKPEDQFDVGLCAKYAESLVQMDEVERALMVLDNVPAYYREYPPEELTKLRSDIVAALFTPHAYLTGCFDPVELDTNFSKEWMLEVLRGKLVHDEVKRLNQQGVVPRVVEMGPGGYHIPIGLKALEAKCTYTPIPMDAAAYKKALPLIADLFGNKEDEVPAVYVAQEIIEHLPSPQDIAVEALRHCHGKWPSRVHLSTPLYTFDKNEKDWRKRGGLAHLRAYTPREFLQTAERIFPGYRWEMYLDSLICLRGVHNSLPDEHKLL